MIIKKNFPYALSLGIITFAFHILFSWLLPITDPVESNYALTAKEMLLSNDYISPIIYGDYWYDKPVFTYWMLILSFKLFGFTDFAAHLPGILAAGASSSLFYYVLKKITNHKLIATWSTLILASSFEFWYLSHAVVTDGYLLLFSIGIFGFSYLGITENKHKYICLAYAFAALAVITKGPVGIILPGLILLIFILYRRQLKDLPYLFSLQGIATFLLIASPWYIAMYNIHGESFINGFLGLHNYVRATVSEHPKQNVWFYYLAIFPITLLPWTGIVISELVSIVKKRKESFSELNAFSLIWGIGVIVFYSLLATKYPTYTYISIIAFALLGGQCLARWQENNNIKKLKIFSIMTLPALIFYLIILIGDLIFPVVNEFYLLLILIPISLLLVLVYKQQTVIGMAKITLAMMASIYLAVTLTILPLLEDSSAKRIAPYLKNTEGTVYFFDTYRTSLNYYTDKLTVRLKHTPTPDTVWSKGKNIMPTIYFDDMNTILKNKEPLIFVVINEKLEKFESSPYPQYLRLLHKTDFVHIYTNQ